MERNRNWQGWAALVLAGLALVVALGGRSPWGGWGESRHMLYAQAQAVPQAPQAPAAPAMERAMQEHMRAMGGHGRMLEGRGFEGGPMMGRGHGGFSFFGIFGMIGGLVKLISLALLGWLLFRLFTQRRQQAAATAAPTTPAGHDPRVE